MLSSSQVRKHFRTIGHQLKPVVTVAQKGLTDSVRSEIDRALGAHELIKLKLSITDRKERNSVLQTICDDLEAECIQKTGHIALLYRSAAKPDPKLSNLLRHKRTA